MRTGYLLESSFSPPLLFSSTLSSSARKSSSWFDGPRLLMKPDRNTLPTVTELRMHALTRMMLVMALTVCSVISADAAGLEKAKLRIAAGSQILNSMPLNSV